MRSKQHGFTLIELMIVVAIVAILAAIAYPSYRNQVMRSHRSEGKAALLQIQVAQEKYYLQNNTYGTLAQLGPTSLGLKSTGFTTNSYYAITLSGISATGYTATASGATTSQAGDTGCVTLTINNTGARTPTSGCW
ncbi:MAG: type IV pilin protein [Steroidobacteraceae bacterium]